MAKKTASDLARNCNKKTGKLASSFEAKEFEVTGLEYAFHLDKKKPFISKSIKE